MSKSAVTDSAPAAELQTPGSISEALETGFLPDDENYRLTGSFEKPAKTDDAASSKKDQSGKDDASAASSEAAASAAEQSQTEEEETRGPAQRKSARTSENRWQKRERELKELREENTRLKAQGTSTQHEQRSDGKQASQPATETSAAAAKAEPKPKIDDVDPKTGKPKFKDWQAWSDAKDEWLQRDAIRQFQETQATTQRESQQQAAEREIGQTLVKKFETARAKYADFDDVALSEKLTIPKGSVVEGFILDSDHAGEVAYYLGKHPEILASFYADHDPKTGRYRPLMSPQRQFRKLMEIEAEVGGSGSGGRSSSSAARPVTQASRPPHQVSGKGTVVKDAVEQAVEEADFETYQRAQNAKELARLKKK